MLTMLIVTNVIRNRPELEKLANLTSSEALPVQLKVLNRKWLVLYWNWPILYRKQL
jgi:hypothetical protein